MSGLRGMLVGLFLVATAAQAEEVAAHVRAGVWRVIAVPLIEGKTDPGPVPELHVAPGSATLITFPLPIVGPDGFKIFGGEGRVDARQVNATTLVLVPTREIGPERIPLAVATAEGRRYPFLLATKPGVVDLEVQVVHYDNTRQVPQCQGGDEIVEALLHHVTIFSRQYERPQLAQKESAFEVDWDPPLVESAVRVGNRYIIQISNKSREPWKVEQAKLEGLAGETLKVEAIRWHMDRGYNLNVIVTEVPEGAGTDFALKSIELVGEDARVASLDQKVSLP